MHTIGREIQSVGYQLDQFIAPPVMLSPLSQLRGSIYPKDIYKHQMFLNPHRTLACQTYRQWADVYVKFTIVGTLG